MARLYADKFNGNNIKITQQLGAPKAAALAGFDQLLLILPERISRKTWAALPESQTLKRLMRRRNRGQVPAVSTRLRNKRATAVHIGTVSPVDSAFNRLTFARQLVAAIQREKAGSIGIWVAGFGEDDQAMLVENVVAAALAAAFVLATFKEQAPPSPLRSLKVIGLTERIDLQRTQAEAEGNNLARWLTALPANKLDAIEYATLLKHVAGENGWQYTRFSVSELKKKGAGAFLAVAQGNADDSACIVRLRYRPAAKSAKPRLSLVGKGIIFDTGGTNLKPFASMLDMHIDMGGSAVAVGTLLTISKLGLDMPVDCWLAITENRTGPTAYKSQDVVTAANGTTVQTIHTDAEGRMALADTLVFACADKPQAVIDYATLTGACMNAVTTRYSGAFTNSPA
ncbi:MAG: leucyl aminopeptidase family protein, partial [Pseudomonadota bacterium]